MCEQTSQTALALGQYPSAQMYFSQVLSTLNISSGNSLEFGLINLVEFGLSKPREFTAKLLGVMFFTSRSGCLHIGVPQFKALSRTPIQWPEFVIESIEVPLAQQTLLQSQTVPIKFGAKNILMCIPHQKLLFV